jgi:hypothetical protein
VHGRYHCQRAGRGDVFNTTSDGAGQPFDGARAYTMRFEPGALPQVNGFWSITMYDPTFNFPPHAINRYAIGDRTPGLKRDADGGLTLYIQGTSPCKDKESNWLPSPASGSFHANVPRGRGHCGAEMGASSGCPRSVGSRSPAQPHRSRQSGLD